MMALMSAALVGCSDNYDPEVGPQTYLPESPVQMGDISVSNSASSIKIEDFIDAETDAETPIEMGSFSVKEGALPANTIMKAEIEISQTEDFSKSAIVPVNSLAETDKITVQPSDLENAYFNNISKNPATTDLYIRTIMYTVTKGNAAARIGNPNSDFFASTKISFTPLDRVKIAPAYYIIGGPNDWAASAADRKIKFQHSDEDVYVDPIFTVVFDAAASGDTWFAIGDDLACDAIANDNDWSQLYGIVGGESEAMSGQLDRRSNLGGDNSFCVKAGAKKIKVTIDMMEQTFTVKTLDFGEYIYEAGNNNGWGSPVDYLYGGNNDGKYVGFMYLDGEFKFRSHENSWDAPDWGAGSSEGSLKEKGSNLKAEAGYYQVNADLATLTYSLTKITTIGIIGPAQEGGWDSDTDMTYNKETGAWETTIKLNADEMKFRANDGWDINWGGTEKALTQGGANIKITEAGTYFVQLFAYCDGKAYCKITKK